MTPEKKAEIERLATELYAKRALKDALGAVNIYGASPGQTMENERKFQLADVEYLEACEKLEAAKRPPDVPRIAFSESAEIDPEVWKNLKHGPIQVVYPLDDEWNAALEAAALECENNTGIAQFQADGRMCLAKAIRALKRLDNSPRGSSDG